MIEIIKRFLFSKELAELELLKSKTKRIKHLEKEILALRKNIRILQTNENEFTTRIMKLERKGR